MKHHNTSIDEYNLPIGRYLVQKSGEGYRKAMTELVITEVSKFAYRYQIEGQEPLWESKTVVRDNWDFLEILPLPRHDTIREGRTLQDI